MKRVSVLLLVSLVIFGPATTFAQDSASIAGAVTDTTGGVLPGVTVVASSPALIEGSRTAVTDGAGVYRIVNLRPGTYTVTFTLDGFQTVVREDIELRGSFAATVDGQLSPGNLIETITVTGETPVVDVQQVKQQQVFSSEVIQAIPTGQRLQDLALLVPSVSSNRPGAVGGSNLLAIDQLLVHGSDSASYRTMQDGFVIANAYQSYTGYIPNVGAGAESTISSGGAGAEWWGGGVVMNVIPKDGGNTYSGTVFATGATNGWMSDNLTDRVKERGLQDVNSLKDTYDVNASLGGPIVTNKLWFFGSGRGNRWRENAGGTYYNKNADDPFNYFYEPDLDRQAFKTSDNYAWGGRITYQATPRNKLAFAGDYQRACTCDWTGINSVSWGGDQFVAPEAGVDNRYPNNWLYSLSWTSPINNNLLLDAGFMMRSEENGASNPTPPAGSPERNAIPVIDVGTGRAYNGKLPTVYSVYSTSVANVPQARASLTYVTGSHSFKVGFGHVGMNIERLDEHNSFNLVYYTFTGIGRFFGLPDNYPVPVTLVQSAVPYEENVRQSETSLYAQDTWTLRQLTLNYGVRFDRYHTKHLSTHFGPGPLTPNRNFTTPDIEHFNQKDITPRFSAAYDLFGDGRTALKASANKYLNGHAGLDIWQGNPAELITNLAGRSWVDVNANFVADCDLTSPAAQNLAGSGGDICGPIPSNWGESSYSPDTTFNPDTIAGWGNRGYNWEFSAGVQRELMRGVSVDVSWFRRVYGNLLVTTNTAIGLDQFDQYTLLAPDHPDLPGGGGYEVGPLLDVKPELIQSGVPVNEYQTYADEFGDSSRHWNGVDVNLNARLGNGVVLAGGFSTGRASTDNCDVARNTSPVDAGNQPDASVVVEHLLYCAVQGDFLTTVKAYGTYTIPRIDVQVAGTYQGVPGPALAAEVTYTPAQIQERLGRAPSGGGTIDIQVIPPGTTYGERLHQLDFRVGKVLRFGRVRTSLNLDLYNALNVDTILQESEGFATFRQAQGLILGRLAKISATLSF